MATYLNYPFDPELFLYNWQNAVDPEKTAVLESGAIAADARIANLISTGSDYYTLPIYDVLGGTPDNYDGATDITTTATTASSQSGIVFGRAHGWVENQFVRDYNSGADPMNQIVSQVAKYWKKQDQAIVLSILDACFTAGSSDTDFAAHINDISAETTDNVITETTIADTCVNAVGDNADIFSLALMHSRVAQNLANLQVLEYAKYTNPDGIQVPMKIAYINGMTVVIDDALVNSDGTYNTYILGRGSILTADAPVTLPVEVYRDPATNGGQNVLYTRRRKTYHVNGFSYTKPSDYTASPTDAQLSASANWSLVGTPDALALAKIVSQG